MSRKLLLPRDGLLRYNLIQSSQSIDSTPPGGASLQRRSQRFDSPSFPFCFCNEKNQIKQRATPQTRSTTTWVGGWVENDASGHRSVENDVGGHHFVENDGSLTPRTIGA